MSLPKLVTNPLLQTLAAPGDTHEVHVIVRRIANHAPYTLRGRRRQYIVSRDHARNAHILKVPLSVWMAGCSAGPVGENESIAYDIQSTRTSLKAPLTFEIWPRVGAVFPEAHAQTPPSAILPIFREVLANMHAPGIVLEALDLFETGNADALQALANSLAADHKTEARCAGANAYHAGKTPAANPFIAEEEIELNAAWLEGFEAGTAMQQAPKPTTPAAPTEPAPLTNAQRQAAHRARKKAEKEAQLQPT